MPSAIAESDGITVFYRERLAANHHTSGSISDEQTTPIAFSSINRQISLFLSSNRSIWSDASDAAAFLDAVDALIASLRGHNSSPAVNRADNLLQQCMLRLEDEFRSMIEHPFDFSQFDPVPPPDLDSDLQRRRGIMLSSQSKKKLLKYFFNTYEIPVKEIRAPNGGHYATLRQNARKARREKHQQWGIFAERRKSETKRTGHYARSRYPFGGKETS
ncbi:hypothetical protein KFK09_012077 [Dendrobium nobile]|uniref:Uncharacterized protein n=1 Tax=Dendrobium nobile TaxID=94219 RepID=A0A8T3BGV3_DENNO|nr:hypothetical protein KFK09_012077 [Dendrobium nobile]